MTDGTRQIPDVRASTTPPVGARVAEVVFGSDHPALEGHFPGDPILPGVVLLAEVQQAIEAAGGPVAACTFRVAKFHSVVRPGERLRIEWLDRAPDLIDYRITRSGRPVATGTVQIDRAPAAAESMPMQDC